MKLFEMRISYFCNLYIIFKDGVKIQCQVNVLNLYIFWFKIKNIINKNWGDEEKKFDWVIIDYFVYLGYLEIRI